MDAYGKNSYRVNEYQFKIKITFPVDDVLFFNEQNSASPATGAFDYLGEKVEQPHAGSEMDWKLIRQSEG